MSNGTGDIFLSTYARACSAILSTSYIGIPRFYLFYVLSILDDGRLDKSLVRLGVS